MDPAQQQAAASSHVGRLHLQKFCNENVAHNAKQLYYIRSVVTSVAGSLAGILGMVNLSGFYLYLVTVLLTNAAIFLFTVQAQPKAYLLSFNPVPQATANGMEIRAKQTPGLYDTVWPYVSFLLEGLQEMAFGYVLWWTLWTALIHVFD